MLEEIKTTQARALSHQLVEIMGLACVSPLVLAQTASLALRGAWEKLDLEIQHNTPPICGNLADLDASVKVLVHVTCHECQSYVHNFNNATPRTGLVAAFADPDWALALGW